MQYSNFSHLSLPERAALRRQPADKLTAECVVGPVHSKMYEKVFHPEQHLSSKWDSYSQTNLSPKKVVELFQAAKETIPDEAYEVRRWFPRFC